MRLANPQNRGLRSRVRPETREFAKALRRKLTPSESALWERLSWG